MCGIHIIKGTVYIVQNDSHNHDSNQKIEENPELNHIQGMGTLGQRRTDQVNTIFQGYHSGSR